MEVYNTLGRARQQLVTRVEGEVTIYACGATVQSAPHMGHGRMAVVFDVIRNYLEWSGYKVTFVTNVTDVEDKIIAEAARRGVPAAQVADEAAAAFQRGHDALGVRPADVLPKATEHIPEMIDMVQRLVDQGHAYESGGDVYFAVRSFPEYGRLSGRNVDDLLSGARVDPGEAKRDPLDFALWKAAKPGEPSWDSPWGRGRPGWHIECSAMAQKYLGFGFDIHGGGADLIFPHHENEIAQAEAAAGTAPFARYWLHNGLLNLAGEKMAKSTGVMIGLLDALEKYPPLALRLFYLRKRYREPFDFTEEAVEDAAAQLDRLWSFRRRVEAAAGDSPDAETMDRFTAAMDDDFNTAEALGALFDAVRDGNRHLDGGEDAGPHAAAYDEIVGVLGIAEPEQDLADLAGPLGDLAAGLDVPTGAAEETIDALLAVREQARSNRQWAVADRVRDGLAGIGIVIEDTPDGPRWHRR